MRRWRSLNLTFYLRHPGFNVGQTFLYDNANGATKDDDDARKRRNVSLHLAPGPLRGLLFVPGHLQKQKQELFHRPVVFSPVGRHEAKADEPEEVEEVVEENLSAVLAGDVGPVVFEVSERVQRLAEGLEQSDGFVVSEKSGDFGAKFVDVEDEAVRQGHVFDRLRQQREDRNEGRSSNGDLQRYKYLEIWSYASAEVFTNKRFPVVSL